MRSLAITLCATALLFAQQSTPEAIVSPDVHPDGRVTFRLHAPKATEVAFAGDWMPRGTSQPMVKGEDGTWTITVGPLRPSIYIYNFILDGLPIADPVNPRVKLRARTSASLVEVRSEKPDPWTPQDVPHGTVHINWPKSRMLGGDPRWIWIYTPPGYEKQQNRRYPVLYLFHGSNDIAGGWVLAGNANFVLDNLIAAKAAEPMILVMPFGHAVPFGAPRLEQAKNVSLYQEYVLQDVMPYIEANYRVAPGRPNRAIAGLSMGGGQSLHIGFSRPDLFSAVGAFSAAVPLDFEKRFAGALEQTSGVNVRPELIWFACGRDDFLFDRSKELAALLASKKIPHTWRPTEGNHTYTHWRQYLADFAPLLFRRSHHTSRNSK
jgi:enterochelin esterase family protein